MQAPGRWQVIGTTTVTTSRLLYDARGALAPAPLYRKIETSWFMEYGLSPDMTLVLNPAVRSVSAEMDGGPRTAHGVSSLEAGARWRLGAYDTWTISFQALARTPAKSDPFFLLENRPRTELRLGAGSPAKISGRDGFMDYSIAWIRRAEAMPDEVKVEATYGWRRRAGEMMLVQYFASVFPGAPLRQAPRAHKVQTSAVYDLKDGWSLQLGSFMTRGGYLTRREQGTVLGVWRRF